MLEYLAEYGLFFAKVFTVVAAIIIVLLLSFANSKRSPHKGYITVTNLNDEYDDKEDTLAEEILSSNELKELHKKRKDEQKQRKKQEKEAKKQEDASYGKPKLFVLEFEGDIQASHVTNLREEVTAILTIAKAEDEVLVKIQSPGGLVHTYGLAASQLARLRNNNIKLTGSVDTVAASGGYLMLCVANNIIAAPFAVVGSIGVVAQIPNFHKLLTKNNIDVEMHTAGEYKRTLTLFGENTEKAREKFKEELEETHQLFKEFVNQNRSNLNIKEVATGEHWYGSKALEHGLVDEIQTSDDYLLQRRHSHDIYKIEYVEKKSLKDKMAHLTAATADKLLNKIWSKEQEIKVCK